MAKTDSASWRLRRLLAMTPSEIALRAGRSAAEKFRRDRGARALRQMATPEVFLVDAIDAADVNAWLTDELSRGRFRLVKGAGDVARLQEALSEVLVSVESVVEAAEAILGGAVPAFGWTSIETGENPDWQADPVSGERWPLTYWAELDFRSLGVLGDPRYVWEINRHHHLVTLARAYALTGQSRYADRVWRDIRTWIEANPPLYGINWASSLELAIRLISWAMAIDIVGADGAREGDASALTASVALQSSHLSANLSVYTSSKNNHLIGEAAGLLVVGAKFPFLRTADALAGRGRAILQRELAAQTTGDGVDREQALQYQALVLEFASVGLAAASCLGLSLAPEYRRAVTAMCQFIGAVAGPSGAPLPSIGDGDGGRVYQLSDRPARQALEAAATASVGCRGAPPAAHVPQDLAPALWLYGGESVARSLAVPRSVPGLRERDSSPFFAEGGYFVPTGEMQHGIIDCGPLGYLSIAAHGHADCLSLVVCIDGQWVLVDPGTCCYHRDEAWRNYFRSTSAHNTVTVDGASQSQMLGPFLWGRRARAEQLVWAPGDHADYFEGAHDGYRRQGVNHRRSVVFGRRGYWLLVDRMEGTGRHGVVATLQLAPGFIRGDATRLDFTLHEDVGVEILTWLPQGAAVEVVEGRDDPPAGWFSAGFGQRGPAPAVLAGGELDLPATIVTAVVPHRGVRELDVACNSPVDGAFIEIDVRFPGGSDTVLMGEVPANTREERFAGTFGLTARRGDGVARSGVDVAEWTRSGEPVEFVSVPNLLVTE